ncbi:MAG: hypothetical protein O2782_02235 [bacterium]|nr:hypothetical protein [bacterium]
MQVLCSILLLLLALGLQGPEAQTIEPVDLGQLPLRVAETGITQGLWLWSDKAYATSTQRQKLLDFCVQYQFNHLALAVYFEDHAASSLTLRQHAGLAQLLADAGERGITVAVLRGAKEMAFRQNHEQSLRELDALLQFNGNQPSAARFSDIHYDIEPYNTDPWRAGGDARRQVQLDYLDFLHAARQHIQENSAAVTLSVDMPYWFDKGVFVLDYHDNVKLFSEHIQDVTDFVTLMSYHRDPVRVLEQVAGEADYADKIGHTVNAGMEVGPVRGAEHFISFQWVPTWQFWQARTLIEEDARRRRGFGGVYVHYYGALYEKLNGEPPW